MSANVALATDVDTDEQANTGLDLARRFTVAGFADTSLFEGIPIDVLLFLLPDNDPGFAEREITAAADSARRGHDVYVRHVRVADLPD